MATVNPRFYGKEPYTTVLVHGGPGAPGEMRPVAIELSKLVGVIEPLQTKNSVHGQNEELIQVIENNANTPVVLIGWSWGAWLAYLVTAQRPDLVKKLILISSGPFEEKYTEKMMGTRLSRLTKQEKIRAEEILSLHQEGRANDKDFNEFGGLMDKADSYSPIPHKDESNVEKSDFGVDIYEKVWSEADKMRKSGQLLEEGRKIVCPVLAIQGDHDPHPAVGVKEPLEKVLKNFRFILLKNCGHHPWYEKEARDTFYEIVRQETTKLK